MKKEFEVKKLQISRETLLTLKSSVPVAAPDDETSNNTGKACCKCA
jgi:hypothetical protein